MSNKLEDRYSWQELADLFADRIEEKKFIETKWDRKDFIEWFMKREHLGLRFDWKLVARAYVISRNLQKEHDHFTVIVGKEGTGKSTLAIQFSSWISPKMDIKDIVFDMPQYISKLKEVSDKYKKKRLEEENRSIQIDEGGINLFSREALSQSNRTLAKTFMVQRFLNVHVGICIPHFWSLDKLIRKHRINTLINIYARGHYKAFVGKAIYTINASKARDDMPLHAYTVPYGYFWEGHFAKEFPNNIDRKKYDKHKFEHIQKFIEDARIEAQSVKMVKVKRLEKEFGIKSDTIVAEIHKGNIDGRQIGKQWFITYKAYEKLMMKGKSLRE